MACSKDTQITMDPSEFTPSTFQNYQNNPNPNDNIGDGVKTLLVSWGLNTVRDEITGLRTSISGIENSQTQLKESFNQVQQQQTQINTTVKSLSADNKLMSIQLV